MSKTLADYPELLKEWHPTKNGNLDPNKIKFSSNKKVWWQCLKEPDHVWETSPNNRTNRIRGCPCCAGRKIVESNCLLTTHPDLVKQWHPTKNLLNPQEVGFGSHKNVWWLGPCGHEWKATVNRITNSKSGCPFCRGLLVDHTNSLASLCPDIAAQWHLIKNDNLTPNDVPVSSGKRVWWICNKGHAWNAKISDRSSRIRGCPVCNESKGELKIRKYLVDNDLTFRSQVRFKNCKYKNTLSFDFLVKLEMEQFLIEYNGLQHYESVKFAGKKWSEEEYKNNLDIIKLKDSIKSNWCAINNINLLVIPYWELDNIETIINNFINRLLCHRNLQA